jgi:hypothetical protein
MRLERSCGKRPACGEELQSPSGAKAGVDFGGICGLAEAVPSQTIT